MTQPYLQPYIEAAHRRRRAHFGQADPPPAVSPWVYLAVGAALIAGSIATRKRAR